MCFGNAAFVAEAYDAMGLVSKNQTTTTQPSLPATAITPRHLAEGKVRLQVPPGKQFDGAKPPAFGPLLPIRLK